MYELWITQGQGEGKISEFKTLAQALYEANKINSNQEGSVAIRYPDGQWHAWS